MIRADSIRQTASMARCVAAVSICVDTATLSTGERLSLRETFHQRKSAAANLQTRVAAQSCRPLAERSCEVSRGQDVRVRTATHQFASGSSRSFVDAALFALFVNLPKLAFALADNTEELSSQFDSLLLG